MFWNEKKQKINENYHLKLTDLFSLFCLFVKYKQDSKLLLSKSALSLRSSD